MMLRICATAIFLAVCALLLREMGFRATPVFAVVCFVFLLSFTLESAELLGRLGEELLRFRGVAEGAEAIFKMVGVGYIAGISSDICNDIGERTIAKGVIVAGRVEILAIALPFLWKILDYSLELLG
ncbi:MAG: hypothetical protein IJX97_04110 [Clostridia bacterium]|nr:hypothetical protein [Clostridia bacterium]MBQ8720074.1 hypothetical protein [Clostridia bacterium]